MTGLHRRVALALAAAATAAATAWVSRGDEAAGTAVVPQAAARAAPAAPAAAEAARQAEAYGARPAFPQPLADPFEPRSWAPPVVAQATAAAAPPLPFTYFGRMTEAGVVQVFLQRGERTYTAAAGDVIDGEYRIETIGAGSVVITYLPLRQRQVLHTGSR